MSSVISDGIPLKCVERNGFWKICGEGLSSLFKGGLPAYIPGIDNLPNLLVNPSVSSQQGT